MNKNLHIITLVLFSLAAAIPCKAKLYDAIGNRIGFSTLGGLLTVTTGFATICCAKECRKKIDDIHESKGKKSKLYHATITGIAALATIECGLLTILFLCNLKE